MSRRLQTPFQDPFTQPTRRSLNQLQPTTPTNRRRARARSLLPAARANAVGALLARLKLSPEAARDAIVRLLGEAPAAGAPVARALGEDAARTLGARLPAEEDERARARAPPGAPGSGPAERYLKIL